MEMDRREDWPKLPDDPDDWLPGPEAETIFTLSFVFELPHRLRINDASFLVGEPGKPWNGWSHAAMAFGAGFSNLPEGSRPSHTIRLGQAKVRGPVALDAATRVFKDWDKGVVPARYRLPRLLRLRLASLRGCREVRSAAVVSHFLTIDDLPEDGDFLGHKFLFDQLNRSLAILNEYIVTLAGMTDEWQISAISRIDLQRYVPFKVTADPPNGPFGEWPNIVRIFDAHPYMREGLEESRPFQEVTAAVAAVRAYRAGSNPFFAFVELYQSAEHHLGSGRYEQSVIAACTATEVFANTLLRFVSKAVGGDPNELASKLRAPFRNQLEHHLPMLLKVPMDINDSDSVAGRWWTDCYLLRNKVVHEGHKPNDGEALAAKMATGAFTRWLGQSLMDDERLEGIKQFTAPPSA